MRAVVMRRFGGPEVLRVEDVPMPEPGPGEALVKVSAVTVNRSFDLKVREDGNGRDPIMPLVLGNDPAGEVVAVGEGTREVRVGDRVAAWRAFPCGTCESCQHGQPDSCHNKRMLGIHRWGGYAEYVAVPEESLQVLPPDLPYADAAVVLRHFPTAIALAIGRACLKSGETALVMGAAGGLGSALIQVAKQVGARVIAAAGSDERVAAGVDLGADAGVNYRQQDLADEVRHLTGGRGVEVVFENIADPSLWPGAFDSLAYGGRLATIGAHGGGTVPLNVRKLYSQHLSVLGGAWAGRAEAEQAVEGARSGAFKAVIGASLPLGEAPQAHRLAEDSAVVGKVVLVP